MSRCRDGHSIHSPARLPLGPLCCPIPYLTLPLLYHIPWVYFKTFVSVGFSLERCKFLRPSRVVATIRFWWLQVFIKIRFVVQPRPSSCLPAKRANAIIFAPLFCCVSVARDKKGVPREMTCKWNSPSTSALFSKKSWSRGQSWKIFVANFSFTKLCNYSSVYGDYNNMMEKKSWSILENSSRWNFAKNIQEITDKTLQ